MRLLSMYFDGTYVISTFKDMNQADYWAESHVNQLHFLMHRNQSHILQWVGPLMATTRWTDPTDPEQAKTAMLLLTLEE